MLVAFSRRSAPRAGRCVRAPRAIRVQASVGALGGLASIQLRSPGSSVSAEPVVDSRSLQFERGPGPDRWAVSGGEPTNPGASRLKPDPRLGPSNDAGGWSRTRERGPRSSGLRPARPRRKPRTRRIGARASLGSPDSDRMSRGGETCATHTAYGTGRVSFAEAEVRWGRAWVATPLFVTGPCPCECPDRRWRIRWKKCRFGSHVGP